MVKARLKNHLAVVVKCPRPSTSDPAVQAKYRKAKKLVENVLNALRSLETFESDDKFDFEFWLGIESPHKERFTRVI